MNQLKLQLLALIVACTCATAQPPVDWIQTYDYGGNEGFWDIYAVPDDGYALCGCIFEGSWEQTPSEMLVVRTDDAGREDWATIYGFDNSLDQTFSIIQSDSGSFLAGGKTEALPTRENPSVTAALHLDAEGEVIWFNRYGNGEIHAVIELKNGEFLMAGWTESYLGYLICIDFDGNVIWEETYEVVQRQYFMSMRETHGGVVVTGIAQRQDANRDVWVVKVDFEGDLIWSRLHDIDFWDEGIEMISCREGGFAIGGRIRSRDNPMPNVLLLKIDALGDCEWWRRYNMGHEDIYDGCSGIIQLPDADYALVGKHAIGAFDQPSSPFAMRVRPDGTVRWISVYEFDDEGFELNGNFFYEVSTNAEGALIAVGTANTGEDAQGQNGLIVKLEPEVLEPILFYWSPEDTVFSVLLGDSVQFVVRARDQQGDELNYLWISGEDSLRNDTTYTEHFDELGEFTVQCQVSDNEFTSAITWHISVVEWYIADFTPDSLDFALRRGRSVDFALDVRALEGVDLAYNWTHIGRNHRREDIGDSDSVTVAFDLTGRQQVVGRVRADDDDDEVFWNIDVMSCVWYWWPHATELTASVDTTIEFAVFPFNPDSDSLRYLWTLDGELLDSTRVISVEFPDTGLYSVTVYAWDGMEVDTIDWRVDIVLPVGVKQDQRGLQPEEAVLYPPVPNPFNAVTTIRFALPAPERVRLSVFDLRGREVRRFG